MKRPLSGDRVHLQACADPGGGLRQFAQTERREIHGRSAQAIEELYADRLEEHYELLAHHYERSGNAEKAVHYLILSGEKSNRTGLSRPEASS